VGIFQNSSFSFPPFIAKIIELSANRILNIKNSSLKHYHQDLQSKEITIQDKEQIDQKNGLSIFYSNSPKKKPVVDVGYYMLKSLLSILRSGSKGGDLHCKINKNSRRVDLQTHKIELCNRI